MTLQERIRLIPTFGSREPNHEDPCDVELQAARLKGGWWMRTPELAYLEMAEQLVAKGFTEDEAVNVLAKAYHAAGANSGEYS